MVTVVGLSFAIMTSFNPRAYGDPSASGNPSAYANGDTGNPSKRRKTTNVFVTGEHESGREKKAII